MKLAQRVTDQMKRDAVKRDLVMNSHRKPMRVGDALLAGALVPTVAGAGAGGYIGSVGGLKGGLKGALLGAGIGALGGSGIGLALRQTGVNSSRRAKELLKSPALEDELSREVARKNKLFSENEWQGIVRQ